MASVSLADWRAWLCVLWLVLLVTGYGSKVFSLKNIAANVSLAVAGPYDSSEFLLTWMVHVRGIAVALLWMLCALGWGRKYVCFLNLRGAGTAIAALALGLTGLGLATSGLGFLGLLSPLCLAVLLVPAISRVIPPSQIFRRSLDSLLSRDRLVVGLAVVTIAFLLMYVGAAVAPERGWDALTYHLRAPRHYLAAHRIHLLSFLPWSFFPFLTEMWYVLGQAFGGDVGAKILNYGFLLLAALTLIRMGKDVVSLRVGWLAALLFVAMPGAGLLSIKCYTDLEVATFGLIAIWAALRPGWSWQMVSAICCGAAMGCKYSGAWVFMMCGVVCLLREFRGRRRFGLVAAAGVLALAVFAVWPVRNWLWTGNPVFPLLPKVFPNAGWNPYFTAEQAARIISLGSPQHWGETLWKVLRFPVYFSGYFGAMLFGFLPALWLLGRRPKWVGTLVIMGAMFSSLWIVTQGHDPRFLIPVAAMLALPAATAAFRLVSLSIVLKVLGTLAVVICITVQAGRWLSLVSLRYGPWRVAAGVEPRSVHLSRYMLPKYEYMTMAKRINAQVPSHARILYFSDIHSYYIEREVIFDAQQVNPPVAIRVFSWCQQPSTMRKRLRQLGIEYVLYTSRVIMFERACQCVTFEPKTRECYEQFWRRYAIPALQAGPLKLYRLRSEREASRHPAGPLLDLPGVQDKLLTKAQDAFEARDWEKQKAVLERLRHEIPDLAAPAVKLGVFYLNRGDLPNARREIQAAGRLGADSGEYWLALALINVALGDASGALAAAQKGVERWPVPRAFSVLAGTALNAGKLEEARRAVAQGQRLNPNDPEVQRVAGLVNR